MHAKGGVCVWLGFLFVVQAGSELRAATLIKARLLESVSSYRSKSGDTIQALVAPRSCPEGSASLPIGTLLSGHLQKVRRVGLGLIHETARIELTFDEFRLPDGNRYDIETKLVGIDNARERVDKRGAIHGIRATASLSSRLGSRLALWAWEHPMLLGPALVVESGLMRFPDPEIAYGRGTELSVDVRFPESAEKAAACSLAVGEADTDPPDDLRDLVNGLPYWAYSKRQPQPMDLVNLVFMGSESELLAAFTAAGWNRALPNSMVTGLHAIRAIAEEREYADAPMRTLLLDGNQPDLTLQDALNTFEKRDHLRIWKRPEQWQGRSAWASSATRDIGATFSMRRPFGFTHQIEGNVDLERDKVVSDLQLTGCVDSVEYITRGQPRRDPQHEFRKGVHTDSRVAVVIFNSCESPFENFADPALAPQPPLAVRLVRRVSLTVRNHFLRDNIVYRSGDAARLGLLAVRGWYVRRRDEGRAEKEESLHAAPPESALHGSAE